MTDPVAPGSGAAKSLVEGIFGGFLGIAAALIIAILFFSSQQYTAVSNYLQVIVAFSGAAVFGWYYLRHLGGPGLAWLAGAFLLWGISNAAWYVAVSVGAGAFTFPSLIDIGFIAVLLLLSSAYSRLYPRKQVRGSILLAVLVLMLVIPVAILATGGVNDRSLMVLLYFFASGSLVITALNHSFAKHPAALAGTLILVLAYVAYPLRETFFSTNAAFTVIGPLAAAGFALIVLGISPEGTVMPEAQSGELPVPEKQD